MARTLRRISLLLLIALGAGTALLAIAVHFVDSPFARARVRTLTHLPIDWTRTELSLRHGIVVHDLSLATAPPYSSVAPKLIHIDRLEVDWRWSSLFGHGAYLQRVRLVGLRAHVVVAADGSSEPAKQTAGTAPGLSALLASLGTRVPLSQVAIEHGQLQLIIDQAGSLRSVDLGIDATLDLPTVNEVVARLHVALIAQDLWPGVPPLSELFALDARAAFMPDAHRVGLEISSLRALDGAMRAHARLDLADQQPAFITDAVLNIDSTRMPSQLQHSDGPLQLRGRVDLAAHALRLPPNFGLDPGGAVQLDVNLAFLRIKLPRLAVDADSLALVAELRAPTAADPTKRKPARADLKVGSLALSAGSFAALLQGARLQIVLDGVPLAGLSKHSRPERVRTTGQFERLTLHAGALALAGEHIDIDTNAYLPGAHPGSLRMDVPIARLGIVHGHRQVIGEIGPAGELVRGEAARIRVDVNDMQLVEHDLLASTGHEHSEIALGALRLLTRIDKSTRDRVAFNVDLDAPNLALLEAFLPAAQNWSMLWSKVGAHVHSRGYIDNIASPTLLRGAHHTSAVLRNVVVANPDYPMTARSIAVDLASQGDLIRHSGTLRVDTSAFRLSDTALGDQSLTVSAQVDGALPRVAVDVTLAGGGPHLRCKASAASSNENAVLADYDFSVAQMGSVAPWIPRGLTARHEVDWTKLGIVSRGHVDLRGIARPTAGFNMSWVRDRLDRARGEVNARIELTDLSYRDRLRANDLTIDRLAVSLSGRAHDATDKNPTTRLGELTLDIDSATASAAEHRVTVSGLRSKLALSAQGKLTEPDVRAALDVQLGALEQDYQPGYPVAKLRFGATVHGGLRGAARIERFELTNDAGGTHLTGTGGIDLAALSQSERVPNELLADPGAPTENRLSDVPSRLPGRVGVDVDLRLQQQFNALPLPGGGTLSGRVTLPLRLESADWKLFAVRCAVGLDAIDVDWPARSVLLKRLDANIPVAVELLLSPPPADGAPHAPRVRLVPQSERASFPRPRFTAHQPYISEHSSLSVERLRIGAFEVGPLAGNLSVDHTRVALDRLEMIAAGGRVFGQLQAELAGVDTRIVFRGGATGLLPSSHRSADRLDANVALTIDPLRLAIEGRAELVHVSKALLLDLIDDWDPYHADIGGNRARLALKFGYPKQVRIGFAGGFASLKLELGGLTRAVRVDEIRGVPVGPLLEKYLAGALRPVFSSVSP